MSGMLLVPPLCLHGCLAPIFPVRVLSLSCRVNAFVSLFSCYLFPCSSLCVSSFLSPQSVTSPCPFIPGHSFKSYLTFNQHFVNTHTILFYVFIFNVFMAQPCLCWCNMLKNLTIRILRTVF